MILSAWSGGDGSWTWSIEGIMDNPIWLPLVKKGLCKTAIGLTIIPKRIGQIS